MRASPGLHRLRLVAYDGAEPATQLAEADGFFRVHTADWRRRTVRRARSARARRRAATRRR